MATKLSYDDLSRWVADRDLEEARILDAPLPQVLQLRLPWLLAALL